MSKHIALLFASLAITGCLSSTDDGTATSSALVIQQDCANDTDCPTGFECEVEDAGSFCKSDDDNDGTCPDGYELEVEHGQSFCTPHGGGSGSSSDDDGAGHS